MKEIHIVNIMKDESCGVDLEKYAKTADFSQELFTVLAQAVKEEREYQEEKNSRE